VKAYIRLRCLAKSSVEAVRLLLDIKWVPKTGLVRRRHRKNLWWGTVFWAEADFISS